jgi:activator of HSP90 ATPase
VGRYYGTKGSGFFGIVIARSSSPHFGYNSYLCSLKDHKKYFILDAPPEEVYSALTNPIAIKAWTGEEAEMSTEPGSEFSIMGGSIVGKNLEFEENKKIVQEWYFGEQETPSIVTIKLHAHPEGTSVELRHTNIPDEDFDDIVDGWNSAYFGALQEFF